MWVAVSGLCNVQVKRKLSTASVKHKRNALEMNRMNERTNEQTNKKAIKHTERKKCKKITRTTAAKS